MDNRFAQPPEQIRNLFEELSMQLNTCMPGIVASFDPATQTVTVTPAIMAKTYIDGIAAVEQLPDIQNVPIVFPYTTIGGFALTMPVQTGDSCLLIFAQRCIDSWHENGGVNPPDEGLLGARHHQLSDAFALMCAPALPEVLEDYATDAVELRNRDKNIAITLTDVYLNLQNAYNGIKLTADGITITGPVTFANDVSFHAKINTQNNVDLTNHLHGGVQSGGGTSGVPK